MMQHLPKKAGGAAPARRPWHCALCAGCLLLCAMMLAACAPKAPGASGVSGGTEAPGISDAAGFGAGELSPGEAGSGKAGAGTASSGVPGAEDLPAQGDVSSNAPEADGDSMTDGEDICGLPLAPGGGMEFPEADRAAALTGGTVALYLDARTFTLGADETIGYTVENTTGHSVGVVFAPRLERWTNGVWEWIPSDIGFCGTPDSIDATHSSSIQLEWFSGLTEGVYRLTYTAAYDGDVLLSEERPFSACFSLKSAA